MTGPQREKVIQRLLNAIACISSREYPHVVADAYLALRELECEVLEWRQEQGTTHGEARTCMR